MGERSIEILVGIFVLFAAFALLALAYKVSNFSAHVSEHAYKVTADFDNIGDLKVRAPVTLAGVRVGEVSAISLDQASYQAVVTLTINDSRLKLPTDSTASILTAGLLGAKYIGLTPGFEETYMKAGSQFEMTHSAVILENLIGQFLFSMSNKDKTASANENPSTTHTPVLTDKVSVH